jgi:hypothetical protein
VGAKWRNKLCVALTNEEGLAFNSLVWFVSPRKPYFGVPALQSAALRFQKNPSGLKGYKRPDSPFTLAPKKSVRI